MVRLERRETIISMDIFLILAFGCALLATAAVGKVIYQIGKTSNLYKLRSSRYLLAASIEGYLGTAVNTFSQSYHNNWFFFSAVLLINLAVYHLLCWSALIWTGQEVKYGKVWARPKAKNFLGLSLAYALFAFWIAGSDFDKIWVGDGAAIATNFWLWTARLSGLAFGTGGLAILFFELRAESRRRKDTTKTWSEFSFLSYLIVVFCSTVFLGTGLVRIILYKFLSIKIVFDVLALFGYLSFVAGLVIFTAIILFDKRLLPIYDLFGQARCRALLAELRSLYDKANASFPASYRIDPYQIKTPRYSLAALVGNLNDIRRSIWRTEAWRLAEQSGQPISEIKLSVDESELWATYLQDKERASLARLYEERVSPENLIPEIATNSIEQTAEYYVSIAQKAGVS